MKPLRAALRVPAQVLHRRIAIRPSFPSFRSALPCGQQFDVSGERRELAWIHAGRGRSPTPTTVFRPAMMMIAMLAIHRHGAIIDSNLDGVTYGKSSGA